LNTHRFKQVDAFTSRPLFGNPVAVVLDADDLDSNQMQRIANWTNFSETTFVLKPTISGPAYRLRIFTAASEIPFAGHPPSAPATPFWRLALSPRRTVASSRNAAPATCPSAPKEMARSTGSGSKPQRRT
jgi:PhzF family phenazine biosynthesis protein